MNRRQRFQQILTYILPPLLSLPLIMASESPIRAVEVRSQTRRENGFVRLFANVFELENGARYSLSTLDAASFSLVSADNISLGKPVSITSVSAVVPATKRGSVVVFEGNSSQSTKEAASIRGAVAEFLPSLRSSFLSVIVAGADASHEILHITPERAENPKALARLILDSQVLESRRGDTAGTCSAVDVFKAWGTSAFSDVDQLSVLVISQGNSIDADEAKAAECRLELAKRGIRVFIVTTAIIPGGGKESAVDDHSTDSAGLTRGRGFVQAVAPDGDVLAALNNIRSYLDDEYVIDFDPGSLFRDPAARKKDVLLQAAYHGNLILSRPLSIEVAEPEKEARGQAVAKATPVPQRRIPVNASFSRLVILVLAVSSFVLASALGAYVFLRKKRYTCSTCGHPVSRDFHDCPFRSPKCVARFSVVQGSLSGKTFPLFLGENTFGSSGKNAIVIKGAGIERRHGKISLAKKKAVYIPSVPGHDRINGWLVQEPRLIAHGNMIRIGDHIFRFEVKETPGEKG